MDFFFTLYVFCSSSVVSSCVFNWNLCLGLCVTLHLDEFFVIFFLVLYFLFVLSYSDGFAFVLPYFLPV